MRPEAFGYGPEASVHAASMEGGAINCSVYDASAQRPWALLVLRGPRAIRITHVGAWQFDLLRNQDQLFP